MTQKKEKGKSSTQKSPVKERNGGGSDAAGLRLDAAAMAKIVGEVVTQLTPILVKTIKTAISVWMTDSLTKEMKKIEKEQATQSQYVPYINTHLMHFTKETNLNNMIGD